MPDRADPLPTTVAPEPAAPKTFKPIALPALKAVLDTSRATTKAKAKSVPCAEELDRFGRSFTA